VIDYVQPVTTTTSTDIKDKHQLQNAVLRERELVGCLWCSSLVDTFKLNVCNIVVSEIAVI
jgi:hypothetical protein